MRTRSQKVGDKIFFFGIKVDHPNATAFLAFIFIRIGAFDISARCQNQRIFLFGYKVLDGEHLDSTLDYFGTTFITIFLFNIFKLGLNHFQNFGGRGKQFLHFFYKNLHLFQFIFNFLTFQTGKLLELHLEYGIGL